MISWFGAHNFLDVGYYNSRPRLKATVAFFVCIAIYLSLWGFAWLLVLKCSDVIKEQIIYTYLDKIERPDTVIDPGITVAPEEETKNEGVYNIMLYGIDGRNQNAVSRSDAIMLVTIDKQAKSVKMTSIVRDSRVNIPGYGMDKLNHAFAYGWAKSGKVSGGAELSLQTINKNYSLSVDQYITINFWALANIIDFIGGVDVDVSEGELKQINASSTYYTNTLGINCPKLESTGYQTINGGQALAYSRIRKIDSDDMRTQRQREVLMSLFHNVRNLNPLKYGELITLFLQECSSSFTNEQLLDIGTWLVANIKSLKFDTIGIPTSQISNGQMIGGVWYNAYDLNKASAIIKEFLDKPLE